MDRAVISKYRLKMRKLLEEEKELVQIFMDTNSLVKGNTYKMMTKCGKKSCRCEREGKLHLAWRISRSHKGRPESRCIDKDRISECKELTDNYRRFRQARAELVKIHTEQIRLVNLMEKAKTKEMFY